MQNLSDSINYFVNDLVYNLDNFLNLRFIALEYYIYLLRSINYT